MLWSHQMDQSVQSGPIGAPGLAGVEVLGGVGPGGAAAGAPGDVGVGAVPDPPLGGGAGAGWDGGGSSLRRLLLVRF